MFTSCRPVAVLAVTALLTGCGAEAGTEDVGSAADAVLSENSLTVNSLTVNSLTVNSLTVNSLTVNSLTVNSLTVNGLAQPLLSALQDATAVGAANRAVFHYLVGCALTPDQSLDYTWSDAQGTHTVTEQGSIGLAPDWLSGSLDTTEQHLVSGCLAARVNYFGTPVPISVRNPRLVDVTPDSELAEYPYVEGSFWGNLFSSDPTVYSCYDPANVNHSRSSMRDCAAGYLDGSGHIHGCGPIVMTGSCNDVCRRLNVRDQYYWGCGPTGSNATTVAVTVGLQ